MVVPINPWILQKIKGIDFTLILKMSYKYYIRLLNDWQSFWLGFLNELLIPLMVMQQFRILLLPPFVPLCSESSWSVLKVLFQTMIKNVDIMTVSCKVAWFKQMTIIHMQKSRNLSRGRAKSNPFYCADAENKTSYFGSEHIPARLIL